MIVFVIIIATMLAGVCRYAASETTDNGISIYAVIADVMFVLIGFYLGTVW